MLSSPARYCSAQWAAVLTHKFGNWRALIVTQIASTAIATTLAVLKFSGALTIDWLFACALAIGLAFTFALQAMSVMVAGLFSDNENGADRGLRSSSGPWPWTRFLRPGVARSPPPSAS